MFLKDHEQKPTWSSRRAQRCLSLSIIFIIILILGLSSHPSLSFPRKGTELKLSTIRPYTYGSTPEAGRPSLPFEDNPTRKSTENPFFDVPYYDEDYESSEEDDSEVPQVPVPGERQEVKKRSSEDLEVEKREGRLIGLH
ncbi:hypothetical protein BDZ45DRAFT_60646 [Acephala macrosclerotiorum]|nr:hypothetical protein BDZ45DRAFT_60646 [Acephala macrosclerotiorum]